jgi:hypothetical protein
VIRDLVSRPDIAPLSYPASVIAPAGLVASPPIWAASDDGLATQPIAVAVVVRVTAPDEDVADKEATVMEVVEMVVVKTMVKIMRGKSRTTKTAADKLVAAAHMASSHRKTAALAATTTPAAAADKRDGTGMGSTESILKVRCTSRLSWP